MNLLLAIAFFIISLPVLAVQNYYPIWSPNNSVADMAVIGDKIILGGDFTSLNPSQGSAALINMESGKIVDSVINELTNSPLAYPDGKNGWFSYDVIANNKHHDFAYIMADGNINQEFSQLSTEYDFKFFRMASDNIHFYVKVYEKGSATNYGHNGTYIDFAKYNTVTNEFTFLNIDYSGFILDIYDSENGEIVYLIGGSENGTHIFAIHLEDTKSTLIWDGDYNLKVASNGGTYYKEFIYVNYGKKKITIIGMRPDTSAEDEVIGSIDLESGEYTEFLPNIPGIMWGGFAIPSTESAMYYTVDRNTHEPKYYFVDTINQTTKTWSPNFSFDEVRNFAASNDGNYLFIAGIIYEEKLLNKYDTETYKFPIPHIVKANIMTGEIEKIFTNDLDYNNHFYPVSIALNSSGSELFIGHTSGRIGVIDSQYLVVLDAKSLKPIPIDVNLRGPINKFKYTTDDNVLVANGYGDSKISINDDVKIVCDIDCELPSIKRDLDLEESHEHIDYNYRQKYYSSSLAKFILSYENKVAVINDDYTVDFELPVVGIPDQASYLSADGKTLHLVTFSDYKDEINKYNFYDIDLVSKKIVNATFGYIDYYDLGLYKVAGSNRLFTDGNTGDLSRQKLSRMPLYFPQSGASLVSDEEIINRIIEPGRNKETIFINNSTHIALRCLDYSYLTCDQIYVIDKEHMSIINKLNPLDFVSSTIVPQVYSESYYVEQSRNLIYWSINDNNIEPYKEIEVIVDQNTPETKISHPNGEYKNHLTFQFECEDINESGCKYIYFTLDGSTPELTSYQAHDIDDHHWSDIGTNVYNPNEQYQYDLGQKNIQRQSIRINSDATVNYFAVDRAGRKEVMKTSYYDINDKPWWLGKLETNILVVFLALFLYRKYTNKRFYSKNN